MTTEQEPTPAVLLEDGTPVPGVEEPDFQGANAELRSYADRLKAENQGFRTRLIGQDLEAIGLDPTQGLGKAIAKEYKGDITREAIAEYASTEYGHQPAQQIDTQQVAAAHQRADQIGQVAQPVSPPLEESPTAAAEADLKKDGAGRKEALTSVDAKLGEFVQKNY